MGGVGICDPEPWACGNGSAERRETGEEVGNGLGELASAEDAFVRIVEGLVGR